MIRAKVSRYALIIISIDKSLIVQYIVHVQPIRTGGSQ